MSRLYTVIMLIKLLCREHHDKCQGGLLISWNQDCWEEYQQPHIWRWCTWMAESEEKLKSLLIRVKEKSEKTGLKFSIQTTKILASGAIASWQIDWEKVETVTNFIFLGLKITADGNCSHEIKRHLLLGWQAIRNLDTISKSRDISLPTKAHIVKAIVFPGVM